MHVLVFCAARRGYRFLDRLTSLLPAASFTVCSFREEPWEPPFLDDIRALAESRGGRFLETRRLEALPSAGPPVDLVFVVGWRYLIPAEVFDAPPLGTVVFHDSLLPEYRGFSPTVWAIVNGEDHTGVSLFYGAEGMDTGEVIDQQRVHIGEDETIEVVVERVTDVYLELLEKNVERLLSGRGRGRPQDHDRATYTCKRVPEDNEIDWSRPTREIHNLIRAVGYPYPGAYSYLAGRKVVIWSAERIDAPRRYVGRVPGRVVEVQAGVGSVVLTGDGALLVKTIQVEGEDRAPADTVLKSLAHTLRRG